MTMDLVIVRLPRPVMRRCLYALVHVSRFAADESFVHFDFAAEFAAEEFILHGKPDAVEHEPCGLLSDLARSRAIS